jgi:hypothetical protein
VGGHGVDDEKRSGENYGDDLEFDSPFVYAQVQHFWIDTLDWHGRGESVIGQRLLDAGSAYPVLAGAARKFDRKLHAQLCNA